MRNILIYNYFICEQGEFILLAFDNQLCGMILPDFKTKKAPLIKETPTFKHLKRHLGNIKLEKKRESIFKKAEKALINYFSSKFYFHLPILFIGTLFQKIVWQNILKVPYGQTITYQDLAIKSGFPKGIRAVAQACRANPLPIFIPCHRIVGKNGISGYSAGLDWKIFLLKHEGGYNG